MIVSIEYRLRWGSPVIWVCVTRYADGSVNQSFQLAPKS